MAHVTDIRIGGASIAQRFAKLRNELGARYVQYTTYRNTLAELRNLSKRELDDLGLDQHALRDIAYESAYGAK